jgi:hypothetical protein
MSVNQQQSEALGMRLFELEDRPVAWLNINDGRVFDRGVWSGPLPALGRKAALAGTGLSLAEFSRAFPEAAKSLSVVLYAATRRSQGAAPRSC